MREKEALHKIIDLEKQIDQRQALELKIEQLKGAAQVMEHMGRDSETKKKMDAIVEELKEKEEELEDLEATFASLVSSKKKMSMMTVLVVILQELSKSLVHQSNVAL